MVFDKKHYLIENPPEYGCCFRNKYEPNYGILFVLCQMCSLVCPFSVTITIFSGSTY